MVHQRIDVPPRLIRLPEVLHRVGWSRSQLYKQIDAGLFPRPIKLSERTVAWVESDLDDWIEARLVAAGRATR